MKVVLTLLCFFWITASLFGQTVLLMHNVDDDKDTQEGPGKSFNSGQVLGFGFFAGPSANDSIGISYGNSFQIQSGYFSLYGAGNVVALGIMSYFDFNSYKIDQSDSKAYITPLAVKKEHFWHLDYTIAPFLRINYAKKRGDHAGKYTDFGVTAGYGFITRHTYRINDPSNTLQKSTKINNRKLNYINKIHYGIDFRFGLNGLSIYAKYRLNNLFKTNDDGFRPPELPRLAIGLMFQV